MRIERLRNEIKRKKKAAEDEIRAQLEAEQDYESKRAAIINSMPSLLPTIYDEVRRQRKAAEEEIQAQLNAERVYESKRATNLKSFQDEVRRQRKAAEEEIQAQLKADRVYRPKRATKNKSDQASVQAIYDEVRRQRMAAIEKQLQANREEAERQRKLDQKKQARAVAVESECISDEDMPAAYSDVDESREDDPLDVETQNPVLHDPSVEIDLTGASTSSASSPRSEICDESDDATLMSLESTEPAPASRRKQTFSWKRKAASEPDELSLLCHEVLPAQVSPASSSKQQTATSDDDVSIIESDEDPLADIVRNVFRVQPKKPPIPIVKVLSDRDAEPKPLPFKTKAEVAAIKARTGFASLQGRVAAAKARAGFATLLRSPPILRASFATLLPIPSIRIAKILSDRKSLPVNVTRMKPKELRPLPDKRILINNILKRKKSDSSVNDLHHEDAPLEVKAEDDEKKPGSTRIVAPLEVEAEDEKKPDPTQIVTITANNYFRQACPVCGKIFMFKKKLIDHLKAEHGDSE